MPKRIAIDATPLAYPGTGVWRVTRTLLDTLLRMESPYEFHLFARHLRGGAGEKELAGHPIHRVRLPRALADFARPIGLTEMLARADLYHATDHFLPIKHTGRAVVTIHDLIFMIAPEKHFAQTHAYFAKMAPMFARTCKRIIAVSEHTKRDIAERLCISPDRIDVIPWAVDRKIFSPCTDDIALRKRLYTTHGLTAPYFLAVSCSDGRKNTPRLLEAYARLAECNPKHHLVVRWNKPPASMDIYRGGPLAEKIHFVDQVDDNGLADLYRGAAAMAFPSLYEGFGLPILEAMSCGTPVITARNSSLSEVAGTAARYVDPLSVDSILEAFEDFENSAPGVRSLREKGLMQANKFSWERTARMTLDVYAKCFESKINSMV